MPDGILDIQDLKERWLTKKEMQQSIDSPRNRNKPIEKITMINGDGNADLINQQEEQHVKFFNLNYIEQYSFEV